MNQRRHGGGNIANFDDVATDEYLRIKYTRRAADTILVGVVYLETEESELNYLINIIKRTI